MVDLKNGSKINQKEGGAHRLGPVHMMNRANNLLVTAAEIE